MQQKPLFLSGALAGIVFFSAIYALASMVEGYSHIGQTVSEIGKLGSPAETYLRLTNLVVAICLFGFSWSLHLFARDNDVSRSPAILMACFAISEIGVAIFPSPHPLHNVFGLSMTIGYMTPLALALSWRKSGSMTNLVVISWIAFILIAVTILLNLSPIFARDLYPLEYYGIIQRSLFVAFYGWCFYVGVKLYRNR